MDNALKIQVPPHRHTTRGYVAWLWLASALFFLRVIGQLLVATFNVGFLPPMDEWYSGLVPYPILLSSQILILGLMATICMQFSRATGWFVRTNYGLGRVLLRFGSVYLAAMVVRYVVRMSLIPDERWTGGAIPIVCHSILAGFMLLLGYHHREPVPQDPQPDTAVDQPGIRFWLRRAAFPGTMIFAFSLLPLLDSLGLSSALAPYMTVMIVAGVVVSLEYLIPYDRSWAPDWKDIANDTLFLGTVQMFIPLGLSWFTAAAIHGYLGQRSTSIAAMWPHGSPPIVQLGLMLLVAEFLRYWLHVAAHNTPALWRLHAVHHSPGKLYWLNVGRFHPVEKAMQFLFDAFPFIVLGVREEVLALYFVFYSTNGFFQHSNVDARYGILNFVVSSAELHRWHHSRQVEESNNNYGNNLIIWDLIFGSWFLPRNRRGGKLGLINPDYPRRFIQQMAAPFNVNPNNQSGRQDAA